MNPFLKNVTPDNKLLVINAGYLQSREINLPKLLLQSDEKDKGSKILSWDRQFSGSGFAHCKVWFFELPPSSIC